MKLSEEEDTINATLSFDFLVASSFVVISEPIIDKPIDAEIFKQAIVDTEAFVNFDEYGIYR